MLTFEEFSAKKKIDLNLFQQAEPALYSEFKSEYAQMGEKSFDHSKKFLFNKIRRAYHLKEQPKPAKTEIELTEIASQAEPLDSPTIAQKPAYTPRFKPSVAAKPESSIPAVTEPGDEKPAAESTQKLGFQPRFKMKVAPVQDTEKAATEPEITSPVKEEEKPAAYKPRFNMKTTAISKPAEEPKEEPTPTSVTKPETDTPEAKPVAYKPRFNMKNIKPETEE